MIEASPGTAHSPISSGASEHQHGPTLTAVLVGRGAELRELLGAAEAACAVGRGWTAFISGEPGIGKTRLAAEFADLMRARGVRVAWAACRQDGGAPPYFPWSQLLGRLGRTDALVVPNAEKPDLARFLLFQAVGDAVRDAAPVLLVLDDLQWADEPSLRLLDALGAYVGEAPVLLLGTYRDTEPDSAAIVTLTAERRLVLGGLAAKDLGSAVADLTGERIAEDAAVALHRRTAGNPFFAAEIVRLQRAEGSLGTQRATRVPGGVRAVLDRRLDRLPGSVEAVLRAAAALDAGTTSGVDAVLLAVVSGHDPVELLTVLEPAVEARFLLTEVDGGSYRFPHALIAETLTARTPAVQRLGFHRQAGAELRSRAAAGVGNPADAAKQLLAAARLSGEPTEARAAAVAGSLAARAAIAHVAYEDAAHWLEDSLDVLANSSTASFVPAVGDPPQPEPDRGDLLCALGEAALAAGDPARSRKAFVHAAEHARLHYRPDVLGAAALGMSGGAGGFEVDLTDTNRTTLLEEALDAVPDTDSALRSALLARLSVALTFTGAERRRGLLAEDAVAMARRINDPRALAAALAARCDALAGPDHVETRSAAAAEIIECAGRVHDRTIELLGHRLRLVALAEAGKWTDVDDEIRAYAAVSEPTGQPGLNWYLPLWRGTRAQMRGDRVAADTQATELRRLAEASGSTNARILESNQRVLNAIIASQPADVVLLMRQLTEESPEIATATNYVTAAGRTERAADTAALLREFMLDVPDLASVNHPTWPLLLALAGETEEAARRLEACLQSLRDRVRDSEWLPELVQAAVAAVLLRHQNAAAAIYPTLAPYGDLFAIEGIGAATWGCVHGYLGPLADVLGRTDDARRHMVTALRLDSAAGAALDGRTRRRAAEIGHATAISTTPPAGPATSGVFQCDGEVWTLEFAGRSVQLRDTKGLRDIAMLLARPSDNIAVQELTASSTESSSAVHDLADRTAIAAYRRRLIDLEEQRTDAEAMHDPVRAERAAIERDALIAELSAVTGLGGRVRRAGSDSRTDAQSGRQPHPRGPAPHRADPPGTRSAPSCLDTDRYLLPLRAGSRNDVGRPPPAGSEGIAGRQ